MKANILRGEMVAKGYTVQDVAKKMGVSRNTLSSRLSGHSSFDTEEIINICKILDIREPSRKVEIFFDLIVPLMGRRIRKDDPP